MKPRTPLIVLQVAGGMTLIVYPGVLLAAVMLFSSAGAKGGLDAALGRTLAIVGLSYPLVWIVLWWLSWRAHRRGRTALAVLLSAPPAMFLVAGLLVGAAETLYTASMLARFASSGSKEIEHMGAQNPLAGAVLAFDAGRITWPALEEQIRKADTATLSKPVERLPLAATLPFLQVERPPGAGPEPVMHSSPLGLALEATRLRDTMETARAKPHLLDAVRLMMARGARLCDREEADPKLVWLSEIVARGATLPDPNAQKENPLVWTIVNVAFTEEEVASRAIFDADCQDPALLDRPTRTYGTPLRSALVRGLPNRVRQLLYNGAELSPEELLVPSLVHAVDAFLARPENEGLREKRAETVRRKTAAAGGRSE